MKTMSHKVYLGNANIVFTLHKSLYFKGISYNVIEHKTLESGSLWYSGVAHRHTGKHNIIFSIFAVINSDGTQTATVGKYKID